LLVIATALFLLASPVYLMTSLRKYLSRKMEPGREASWALILYLFLFVLFVLLTPIINGYYIDRSLIRYNYAALVMGAVGFVYLAGTLHAPFSLPSWLRKYFTSVCSLAFLALLLTVGVKNHASEGFHNYLNYYPEDVRILDELKSEYGLSYGLSGYWQAKHSTILSRNDLRLYSVSNGSFKPSYHVTNENWFHDGGKGLYANPTFNFLETSAYSDTRKLHKLFGDRIDTIYHDEKLLVIKVPDFKLRREDREIYLLDP